jgi:hypothetical protein
MIKHLVRIVVTVAFAGCMSLFAAAAQQAPASSATTAAPKTATHHHNWFVGDVEKVDEDTKTVVVKGADGTEHAFKYTGDTTVHGIDGAAKATDLGTKKGAHVAIHYTGKGTEKTADAIEDAGKHMAGDEKKPAQ